MTTTRNLQESWFRTQQFQGNETGQLRALTGLEQWQVYFFQGNAWANCQSTGNVVACAARRRPLRADARPAQTLAAAERRARRRSRFAPGSGLAGNLVRDTLHRAMSRRLACRASTAVAPPRSAARRCSRR